MATAIQWNDEYEIGVAEIDLQHKNFVGIIAELNDAINNNLPEADMQKVMDGLEQYMKYHFSTEEKYFEKFKYEGAEEHIQQHQEFVKKINSFKAQYQEHKTQVSFELIDFLEDWLVDHMDTMDKKYVECFKRNGVK